MKYQRDDGWGNANHSNPSPQYRRRELNPLSLFYKNSCKTRVAFNGIISQHIITTVHPPGLEPGRPCGHGPLKPARLPFRHECKVVHECRSKQIVDPKTWRVSRRGLRLCAERDLNPHALLGTRLSFWQVYQIPSPAHCGSFSAVFAA